jgi:competence ComEA-like helix-hairpin-helix protein
MPRAERRALLLLVALAVAGQAVRHLITKPGEPPGQVQLLATLGPGSPSAHRDSAMERARPLAPGERVNLESADAGQLSRLPRVGPSLAKKIVADRNAHGPFGSLEGLDRVPGVGPGLLKALAPYVLFGAAGALEAEGERGRVAAERMHDASCIMESTAPPPRCPPAQLNINTASASELDALPGVGPARAAAILQYREAHGPFASVDQLVSVPGFGRAALARVREGVTVR